MLASLSRIAQSLFVVSLLLTSVVDAHPGEPEPVYTARQLERRQAGIQKRHNLARNCNSAVLAYEARRKAKREAPAENPKGRGHGHKPTQSSKPFPVSNQSLLASSTSAASATSSASDPTYTSIQNTTCVLTPEAEEGPYYIHEELIRSDIRDGMDGVPLTIDFGVMDITTCTPLENALVDIWHCNATGFYSGFIASESSTTSGTNTSTGGNTTMTAPASMSSGGAMPSGSMNGSMSMSIGGGGGGGGGGSVATDEETFGRGAYPTNSEGVVEFSTVFPGFYAGRAVHVHTAVLTNYTTNDNGTLGQEAGHVQHIGQVFFDESWTQQVIATSPYSQETIQRTTNAEDRVYADENTAGFNATVQLTMLGESLSDGLLAYITLGIDPSASYSFASVSYYTGDD